MKKKNSRTTNKISKKVIKSIVKKNPMCKTCKQVKVAKGTKISKSYKKTMKNKKGSSNTGDYKNVSPKDFAGKAGGASPYSYPINSLSRAKSALKLAHNAPDPEGIRRKVYDKYPQLKK
jgi:hypothetical protein